MVKSIVIENVRKVKKAVPKIEGKLKIHINVVNGKAVIKGSEVNEFLVGEIVRAVDFGFHVDDALLLKSEEYILKFVEISEHTRRKNMGDVRARLIGREGKAKRNIENLTGSVLVVGQGRVGVLSHIDRVEMTIQAVVSLIQGSKHGNVFAYLEKQNANLKDLDSGDLGLKDDLLENSEDFSDE